MTGNTIVLTLLVLCLSVPTFSKEIGGATLPDEIEVGSEKLVLNGVGLRKKLFIKVYAGGLYLKAKNKDAKAIIDADEAMSVRMHFIYDGVAAEKLIEAWNEGFTNNGASGLDEEIKSFNALFNKEAKKGDYYDITYVPGTGVRVSLNGEALGVISGAAFKKAVFAIWLGSQPADPKLKKGMLGK